MGKAIKGIGVGVAGLAALGGSFALGRGTSPETETNGTNIETLIAGYNAGCAELVLEAAGLKFVVVENDPTTPKDELYESRKTAEADSQEFIKTEMTACMAGQVPSGLTGYEVQIPEFTPNDPITTSTEG